MKHTIFTPVYNRACNMLELAKHMAEIDYPRTEFEWIIVDDGSTDNLKDVLQHIKDSYPELNIRCFHKENGGIHTAQNLAIKNASGDYITRIDSDDYLLPDCMRKYDDALKTIPDSQFDKIVGVVGLCMNSRDMTVRGTAFPEDSQISKGYLLRRKGVTGDKNFCMKTCIMKEHLIPEYPDTKWVPEGGILWLELDKKYHTLFINVPISVCAEPNDGSYLGSLKRISLSNAMSMYYSSIYQINRGKGYYSLKTMLKSYVYVSYSIICANQFNNEKYQISNIYRDIDSLYDKLLATCCMPLAYWMFIKQKRTNATSN